jgi:hypothetical protein
MLFERVLQQLCACSVRTFAQDSVNTPGHTEHFLHERFIK